MSYTCAFANGSCGATFVSNNQLAYHMLFDHNYCHWCSNGVITFTVSQETPDQHIAACQHSKCTKSGCARLFYSLNSYKNHYRVYHQTEIKLFYSDKSNNPQYEAISKINDEFKCICNKTYSKPSSLSAHWRRNCPKNSPNNLIQEGRNVRPRLIIDDSQQESEDESDDGSQVSIAFNQETFLVATLEQSDLFHMVSLPLAFNQKYGLMLCTLCCESLINRNSLSAYNHFMKHHADFSHINLPEIEEFYATCKTANNGNQLLNESYIRDVYYGDLLEPIEGIKVYKDGFR